MKTAIVLSGGGAKGAFQAGVLDQLSSLQVGMVVGTSAGALNAAGFAYLGSDKLRQMWEGIRSWRDVFSINLSSIALSSDGILNAGPLRKKVERIVIGRPRFPVCVSRVRLEDGALLYSNGGDHRFVDDVVASCSIPGAVSPVEQRQDNASVLHYVDGGTRENVPLRRAIDLGASRIIIILCSPWHTNPNRWIYPDAGFLRFAKVAMRAADIACHEIFINDIVTCLEKNKDPSKRKIELTIYAPTSSILDTMEFDPIRIRKAIQAGREAKPMVIQSGRQAA